MTYLYARGVLTSLDFASMPLLRAGFGKVRARVPAFRRATADGVAFDELGERAFEVEVEDGLGTGLRVGKWRVLVGREALTYVWATDTRAADARAYSASDRLGDLGGEDAFAGGSFAEENGDLAFAPEVAEEQTRFFYSSGRFGKLVAV